MSNRPASAASDAVDADASAVTPIVDSLHLLHASGLYRTRRLVFPVPLPTPVPVPVPLPFPPLPIPTPTPRAEAPATGDGGSIEDRLADLLDDELDGGERAAVPWWQESHELRLDVDGRYPQMTASGLLQRGVLLRTHWVATLRRAGKNVWTGRIWYKDGTPILIPHTSVRIRVKRSLVASQRRATIEFLGGGAVTRKVDLPFVSSYFREVAFEYDHAAGVAPVTSIDTHAHPNRPADIAKEDLTIEKVYGRSGFRVSRSGDGQVPLAIAGANGRWSDAEMHDAMQAHWSKFANRPQWALWTFFASLHEAGPNLGGIMFDDIGPQHRQGTAIFNDSFIRNAPAGDAAPAPWVQRMRFWTACHEMGHAFNLAHSWQKSLGTPWLPLADDPEARSFMNYPYNVAGGQAAFFADFEFRFSDQELLFLRHAPERFVRMGDADWFDHHGFEELAQVAQGVESPLRLAVRVNRPDRAFEFLEPVMLELKLENVSTTPQVVDRNVLAGGHDTVVVLQKHGSPATQWRPYARYLHGADEVVLAPGEAIYSSLFVSAGRNGWDLAEPGRYRIRVAIQSGGTPIVSAPLDVRILTPQTQDEERLAQDLFRADVGQTLAFDGSRYLDGANQVLQGIAERLPGRRVGHHARIALAVPAMQEFKSLDYSGDGPSIRTTEAKLGEVERAFEELFRGGADAATSLGHIDYKYYVDRYTTMLAGLGKFAEASKCQRTMGATLATRRVKPAVLEQIEQRAAELQRNKKGRRGGAELEGVL